MKVSTQLLFYIIFFTWKKYGQYLGTYKIYLILANQGIHFFIIILHFYGMSTTTGINDRYRRAFLHWIE